MKRHILCIIIAIMTMYTGCVSSNPMDDGGDSQNASDENSSLNTMDRSSVNSVQEEQGMENDTLSFDEICNQITNNSGIKTALIVKDGSIIMEHHKNGYNQDSVTSFNSCAKSIMSVLIGIAIDQGLIDSIDTKISNYFPEIENDTDSRKKAITIKHLLEFTPGLDWPEWGAWNYWPSEFVSSSDWVGFVLNRPMIAEPGTEFAYNTGASQLLSAIIQKVSGKDALSYAQKNLFDPLDISGVEWGRDPQGITTGGFQLSMKPADAMKIGQLYINKGKSGGKQIVSEEWVTESTQVHSQGGYFGSKYGYHWWVEDSRDIAYYYAMGYGGQYIFVAPERDVVAVFTSNLSMQQMGLPKSYFEVLIQLHDKPANPFSDFTHASNDNNQDGMYR